MFWRSENEIIDEFVRLFRRILHYKQSWTNVDSRIVSLDANTKVYESFFESAEQYPYVAVSGGGFNRSGQSFNSYLGGMQGKIADMGTRGLGLGVIDENSYMYFALPSSVIDEDMLYAIEVYALNSNAGYNIDTLDISLYKDYQTSPVLVSSASIPRIKDCCDYKKYYAEFYPVVALDGADYWLKFSTTTGNSFFIGLDTLADNVFDYLYTGSIVRASGSIHGRIVTPPIVRLGGAIEGVITIRCGSKNSTRIARDTLTILANYIELFKQAQLSRGSDPDMTILTLGGETLVDEWLLKDIRIKSVRQSNAQERRRGDNDIIFLYDLTVEYYAEWHQDYDKDTIGGFDIDLESFIPPEPIGGEEEEEVFNIFDPGEIQFQ